MSAKRRLRIDKEFESLIAPLSDSEYEHLKQNILSDGCREPIAVWDGVILDGHNRYKICTENKIPFQTVSMNFADRSEAIMWMLKNQLGRRNLTDFQRNEVSLKYEEVIAEQMKERQRKAGGDKVSVKAKTAVDQMNHSGQDKTTRRKELAKIAGTSEGSIQRSKLILEKGTPEQIDRARKGGEGNSITAIANEIKGKEKPEQPKKPKKKSLDEEIIGDLNDTNKVVSWDMDSFVEEFEVNFDTALDLLQSIIKNYSKVLLLQENKEKLNAIIEQSAKRIEKLKGDF